MFLGLISPLIERIRSGLLYGGVRLARRDGEGGQGLVEYSLILVLIAIVVVVILGVVGRQVNNVFSNVSNGIAAP
jgi:pilus assembly protein Flp/PilA